MTAPLDLTPIKVSLAGLAPLPWTVATEIDGHRAGRNTVVKSDGKRVFTVDQTRPHHDTTAEANVAFAAAAPETILALVREVEHYRDTLEDLAKDCEAFPESHHWAAIMTATGVRLRLILAGERP
jgi:hypothetical protein